MVSKLALVTERRYKNGLTDKHTFLYFESGNLWTAELNALKSQKKWKNVELQFSNFFENLQ
jgi:hypothetical protein